LITKFDIADIAREIEVTATNECFHEMDENMTEEIFALNNSIRNKSSEATQNIIAEMKNNSKTVVSGTNLIIAMKHLIE
jgi:phosphate transport system protein